MAETGTGATDTIDVRYVARLARLDLSEAEIGMFQGQLAHVLEYVHRLSQLDVEGIEPTSHAAKVQNVFRRDEVRPGLDRDGILANAPARVEDQFMVPKIFE